MNELLELFIKHGFSKQYILGTSRKRTATRHRFAFYAIAFQLGYTVTEIAGFLNKHHATVISGKDKFEVNKKRDWEYRRLLDPLVKEINKINYGTN